MAKVERTIVVKVPVRTAYNQWTQFEEFPRFMEGVEEVSQIDDSHIAWVANVGGKHLRWESEIFEQEPDVRISWRATAGKDNAGTVAFEPLDEGSCKVALTMAYDPEGVIENVGDVLGLLTRRVEGDLLRFKEFVERRGTETGAWRGEIHRNPHETIGRGSVVES